jgi:DNA-binding beta-propeller fold protein YncE
MRSLSAFVLLAGASLLISQPAPPVRVGPFPGGVLLPNGWSLRPAGRQLDLDTFPMSTALTSDGRFLLVLHGGYNPPSIAVLDPNTEQVIHKLELPDAWLGLALAPGGRTVYVGGGSQASIYELNLSEEGRLKLARTFQLVPESERTHRNFVGDVVLSPDGRLLYVCDFFQNQILVVNPQSGMLIERHRTGRRPYRLLFHPDGRSYFVTSWADGSLHHHEAGNGRQIALLRLGPHPTDMVWRDRKTLVEEGEEFPYKARLFVAAANTNRVYTVGIGETRDWRLIETINVAMAPQQPLGMTPSALALNEDQSRLFVVCSDANAVAVVDVTHARSQVLGFVPAAWYPTAATVLPGGKLVVLNGKGSRSYPNPRGLQPVAVSSSPHAGLSAEQYVGRLQRGSASFIDPFDEAELNAYTETVFRNSPYRDDAMLKAPGWTPGNPVPESPGDPSPIQHVLYIVKENRTYDQVLGDLEIGTGDKRLTLFGEEVTPNHHKLAREFVLLDNFYVNGDVSADGHNWSTAAIAPHYVMKMWQNSYAPRRRHYDYEGGEPAAGPPAGYIWTQVLLAGLSMRNYGYFATNLPKPASDGRQIQAVRDPALAGVTNLYYRAPDLDYPDVDRARVFLRDLAQFEAGNSMPRFMIMRLGNDHTAGATPGRRTPRAYVADNDYALGLIVEACSRSRFWPKMAIFVLEDDAQNGPDHVDSHRSLAFVLSPYTRRGIVDSSFYNTTSVLRTIELILGLRPMTMFDASAPVMYGVFDREPNPKPYEAVRPRISLEERNPQNSSAGS